MEISHIVTVWNSETAGRGRSLSQTRIIFKNIVVILAKLNAAIVAVIKAS